MVERKDVVVPEFNLKQLSEIVLANIKELESQDVLKKASFIYPFTTSNIRRSKEEENFMVLTSRGNGKPPLQRRTANPDVHINLTSSDIRALQPSVFDVFGHKGKDGWNHWAVSEVEALIHIKLWSHAGRGWRKVGGDHAQGRKRKDGLVDVSRRHVLLLVLTGPISDEFVWNVDHNMKCTQQWQKRIMEIST